MNHLQNKTKNPYVCSMKQHAAIHSSICSLGCREITNGYFWVYCKFHNEIIGAFCERNELRNKDNTPISIDGKMLYYFSNVSTFLGVSN